VARTLQDLVRAPGNDQIIGARIWGELSDEAERETPVRTEPHPTRSFYLEVISNGPPMICVQNSQAGSEQTLDRLRTSLADDLEHLRQWLRVASGDVAQR
jgi:hypothetical protein